MRVINKISILLLLITLILNNVGVVNAEQIPISKLPFKFVSTIKNNKDIVTQIKFNNKKIKINEVELTINKVDNKKPVFSQKVKVKNPKLINGIKPDTEYFFDIKIKRTNQIETYTGKFVINTKKLQKNVKYSIANAIIINVNHNIITLKEVTAALVRNETESNNTYTSANTIYDNEDVYGLISSTTDVDWYKVQFSSNGKADFSLGNIPTGCDYDIYLYDSDGTTQLASSIYGGNTNELVSQFSVTAGKWYYIRVIPYSGYNVSSSYLLRAKNYPTTSGDMYEPNNSTTDATSIGNNFTTSSVNIDNTSDVDYYKFTLSSRSNINIQLSNIPSGTDYEMKLFNSTETEIGSSTAGGNTAESIPMTLDAGTYYIKIYSFSGSSTSNYYLQVSSTSLVSGDRYEPNDTISVATNIASSSIVNDATLHSSSDIDYFKFALNSKSNVNIGLSNIPTGTDYDIKVYNSAGSEVSSSTAGSNTSENISATLDTGTYYVKAYSYSGSSTSPYYLQINSTIIDIESPSIPEDLTVSVQYNLNGKLSWLPSSDNVGVMGYYVYRDSTYIGSTSSTSYTLNNTNLANGTYEYTIKAYDAAGNVSQSSSPITVYVPKTIQVGTEYFASLDIPGELDVYSFTPTTSGLYVIQTTGSTDTVGELFDSSEGILKRNDDMVDTNTMIYYYLEANQTYYFTVEHFDPDGVGAYGIKVVSSPLSDDNYTSRTILLNSRLSGNINYYGDEDVFTFTPTATRTYTIESSGVTDVVGVIYDQVETELAYDDDSGTFPNFKLTLTLNANQTYYIKVTPFVTNTGAYSLIIQ